MSAVQMTAVTARVSLEQAHDALIAERVKRELYSQQDDVGDWAQAHADSLRVGLSDRRLAELAEQERHDRVVAESVKHFAGCRGMSCRQGRLPCRERCSAEMACHVDDEPAELSLFTPQGKAAILLIVALLLVWLCWLAPLTN